MHVNWLRQCKQWLRSKFAGKAKAAIAPSSASLRRFKPSLEQLEAREVPSVVSPVAVTHASSSSSTTPYTPDQILAAYGISSIAFSGGVSGTGAGQTIAIVDAYDDPNIASDLAVFDSTFGIAAPPSFEILNQYGQSSNLPGADSSGAWALETALDVEWAHAIAPGANIVLVEANSANTSDMFAAVATASHISGVSVVSMSWGTQGGFTSENSYDSYFNVPGVTFVASTGDNKSPADYPAESPYVVAVGGTTLNLSGSNYGSESAWAYSGGGLSTYEGRPTYQNSVANIVGNQRGTPDVAFDADPNTGVYVYDTFNNSSYGSNWLDVGGTSLGAPAWAGLIAIADQGRAHAGLSTLSSTQTLNALYGLSSNDFHDVTSGGNGTYGASPGYDLVTGLGSPVANRLVVDLAASSGTINSAQNSAYAYPAYIQSYLGYAYAYQAYASGHGSYTTFAWSYTAFLYSYYAYYYNSIGQTSTAESYAYTAYQYGYWVAQMAYSDWTHTGNTSSYYAYYNAWYGWLYSYYTTVGY
jgi:subtilase family serine protease